MLRTVVALIVCCLPQAGFTATWSETELHIQRGELNQPFASEPGTDLQTTIFTIQHASAWEYGSNFVFFDYARTTNGDELYAEWYPAVSSQAVFDLTYPAAISDIGFVMGINAAPEADVLKLLPGVQINWKVPGFAFFNTLVTAYIDDSKGVDAGGAPAEGDSFMVDAAWRYPLSVGNQYGTVEGHVEYISSRETEIPGARAKDWVLAQVQLRWDAGHALFNQQGVAFLGVEYQYWNNKLGTSEDESAVQLLAVWRF